MLEPFHAAHGPDIVGWVTSAEEARRWGGRGVRWPLGPSVFRTWHADPDVRPYVLVQEGVLLGYGEVWIDEGEREVELARIIVRPERRGQGVGLRLVTLLLERAALTGYPTAFVRVAPENATAIACYRQAGFLPVSAEQQRCFNEGQPIAYAWLQCDLRGAAAG